MIQFTFTNQTFASLPWYDLPEIRHATNDLWNALAVELRRAGLCNIPPLLNREVSHERQWGSDGFLFGQACGYDVIGSCADQLQVLATPCYEAPGCEGSDYSSFVVVRQDSRYDCVDDLRGTRCVINTPTSHSGMNVIRALVAPLHSNGRFFSSVQMSGSHDRSLRMIRDGQVDVASIDCVSYALLKKYRPSQLVECRVIHRTEQVPAPPYVTSIETPPAAVACLQAALFRVLDDPAMDKVKEVLLLREVEVLHDEAYQPIEDLESIASTHNYHEIPSLLPFPG